MPPWTHSPQTASSFFTSSSHDNRSTILPKLDYCCAVWDPHHSNETTALDRVQRFAGRVITHQWQSDHSTLLNSLNWQPLQTRRRLIKLKVCYNILNNYSCIPPSVFTPHPYPHLRHSHSKMVLRPNAKTNSHKYSFFIDVIPIWNSLPPDVINSPSPMSFKARISALYI